MRRRRLICRLAADLARGRMHGGASENFAPGRALKKCWHASSRRAQCGRKPRTPRPSGRVGRSPLESRRLRELNLPSSSSGDPPQQARRAHVSRLLAAVSAASLAAGAGAYLAEQATARACLLAVLSCVTGVLAAGTRGLAGGLLALAITVSAWGSATGFIPQVAPWDR